jgi:hypothetical protein
LLTTNQDYQKRFLEDPVAALAQQGLQLSFDMQQDIRQQARTAKTNKDRLRKEFIVIKLAVVLITTF